MERPIIEHTEFTGNILTEGWGEEGLGSNFRSCFDTILTNGRTDERGKI
jgi:hypothetical protein